jgi:clan AA aspartic protease (TIGR02281 family)
VLLLSISKGNTQSLEVTEKYINDRIVKCEVYRPGGGFGVVPLHSVSMDSMGFIHAFHSGKSVYTFKLNPVEVYYTFIDNYAELGATSQLIKIECNSKGRYSCINSIWSGSDLHGNYVSNHSGSENHVVIHFYLSPESFDAIKLAFARYIEIAREKYQEHLKNSSANDPFLNRVLEERVKEIIPLIKANGVYEVPVTLNGIVKLNFILDSGAGEVFISPDVFLTLLRGETIAENDFVGEYSYEFANGRSEKCKVYVLKSVQVGTVIISNVKCAVANNIIDSMLLGQSFLERLGKYTIDYNKSQIVVN